MISYIMNITISNFENYEGKWGVWIVLHFQNLECSYIEFTFLMFLFVFSNHYVMVVNSLHFVLKQTWVWSLALSSTTNLGKLLNHWKLQFFMQKKITFISISLYLKWLKKYLGTCVRCNLKGWQETSHSIYMLSSVGIHFRDGELQMKF